MTNELLDINNYAINCYFAKKDTPKFKGLPLPAYLNSKNAH